MAERYYEPIDMRAPLDDFSGIDLPGESSGGTDLPGGTYLPDELPNGRLIDNGPIPRSYVIGDDGRARMMPGKLPDDFRDYLEGINDWQMDAMRKSPPSYDEWKKAQDPDWEPEDGSIELPEELLEALNKAAEESGKEPPYSITITEENNPELFHKFEEMFNGPRLFDPKLNKPTEFPGQVFDPLTMRYYPAEETPSSGSFGLENDPEFMEAFNRNIEGLDLDEIFPEPKGLGTLISDDPNFNPENRHIKDEGFPGHKLPNGTRINYAKDEIQSNNDMEMTV